MACSPKFKAIPGLVASTTGGTSSGSSGGSGESGSSSVASKLAVTGVANVGTNACATYTITSQNSSSSATAVTADLSGSMSGEGTGAFYSDSACTVANANFTITSGTSSTTIYYKPTMTGQALTLIADDGPGGLDASTGSSVAVANSGTADTSFDTDGMKVENISASNTEARASVIDSSGRLLVAGNLATGTASFFVARYLSTGALDTSFDTDGVMSDDFAGAGVSMYGMALQSDGKIIVAGGTTAGSFAVTRLNTDGSIDGTFGRVTFAMGGAATARAVAIQSDGNIVLAGIGNNRMAVARITSAGALDTTFDTDGMLNFDITGGGSSRAYAVLLDSSENIIVGGDTTIGFQVMAVARLTSTGAFDTSFDTDGMQTINPSAGGDTIYSLALQSDGKIVAGGTAVSAMAMFSAARLTTAGALDATFSGDGMVTTAFGVASAYGYGVKVQSDGMIVVTGYAETAMAGPLDFAYARYTSAGVLDTNLDTDGIMTLNLGGNNDYSYAAAMDSNNVLYSVGASDNDLAMAKTLP